MRNNNINDPLPLAMSHSEQNRFIGFESKVVALWRINDGKLRDLPLALRKSHPSRRQAGDSFVAALQPKLSLRNGGHGVPVKKFNG
jgi:hypothetical protein